MLENQLFKKVYFEQKINQKKRSENAEFAKAKLSPMILKNGNSIGV